MSYSESIYRLLPTPVPVTPNPPRAMYRPRKLKEVRTLPPPASTFGCVGDIYVLGAGKITKKPHAHLGPPPRTQAANPRAFLKGGTKQQRVPATVKTAPFHYPNEDAKKPALPLDAPLMGLRSDVDFITANALEVIHAGEEEKDDDEEKKKKEMDYLHKPEYGQVPAYLRRVQAEVRKEDALVEAFLKKQQRGGQATKAEEEEEEEEELEVVSEEERLALILALKTKWNAVNAAYQKTAHQGKYQSTGAQKRKALHEKEMTQLEQDIALLERAAVGGAGGAGGGGLLVSHKK